MSLTINKVINSIVYESRYPLHNEILEWAEQLKEYESIIKIMQEHNLCTVTARVEEVRQRNFYTTPIYGTGRTMTYEDHMPGILLSTNNQRIVNIKNPLGIEFSKIVEQRYSTEIATKHLNRIRETAQNNSRRENEKMNTAPTPTYSNRTQDNSPIQFKEIRLSQVEIDRVDEKLRYIHEILAILYSKKSEEEFNRKLSEAFDKRGITPLEFVQYKEKWKTKKLKEEAERRLNEQGKAEMQALQAREIIEPFSCESCTIL